jgi:hypothetical protein
VNAKDFKRLVARDGACLHCGETEAIAPNHRANRGMGGSKERDVPSNLVVLCSVLNGLIESDDRYAKVAIEYGWKVSKWADWRAIPVFDTQSGEWHLLDDEFGYKVVNQERAT